MRARRWALGLLTHALVATSQILPSNPSTIFTSTNTSIAYIFSDLASSNSQTQLLSLDYSKSFSTSAQSYYTLSEALPFLRSSAQLAYTPAIDAQGSITVITGNCSSGASGAEIWVFQPDASKSNGNGTWTQYQTTAQQLDGESAIAGSNYLADGVVFAEYVDGDQADTRFFVFGGMCPYSNSTTSTWQSSAEYSDLMMALSPEGSGSSSGYDMNVVANQGPPIAQAGATLTGLPVTYSVNSSAERQAQQQDLILIGGHTEAAFINMSQVAIFSLPAETWAFTPVQQPLDTKSDLALERRESTTEVTPRSGHSAVLSETGDSIVVFGGWVGNIDTPATPQLAVLELGAGYGGSGDWSWTIPSTSGDGPAAGGGIFGHGATILPGNVMLVAGGHEIMSGSTRRTKRDTSSASSPVYLYNISSKAWLESYTPDEILSTQSQQRTGSHSQRAEKIGLGAGLGAGALLAICLIIFYFWYSRRLRRARDSRQRALLTHSSDGSSIGQMDQPFLNEGGFDGRGGGGPAVGRLWPNGGTAGLEDPNAPEMQHTTGMWVNVPSPTRGLRKGVGSRNYQYQPAPRFDEKRISRGGSIHPIAEQENEDGTDSMKGEAASDILSEAERRLREVERVLNSPDLVLESSPNPLGSHPVSPEAGAMVVRIPTGASGKVRASQRPLSGEANGANWAVERGPNDALYEDAGRTSPTRSDERTSSTLSERSHRSTVSSNSITRTMSTRTGAIMAAAAAAHRAAQTQGDHSPTDEHSNTLSTNGGRKSPYYFNRARSSTHGSITPGFVSVIDGDGDSFTTARSTFTQLQNEGEALLGGQPAVDRDDPYQRATAAHSSVRRNPKFSTLDHTATTLISPRRRGGLMGSLKRALNVVSLSERSFSLTGSSSELYKDNASPTKESSLGQSTRGAPRRAVSDGGALLKQKRGRKDWDEEEKTWLPYHDDPEDWGEPRREVDKSQAEEDWDVESAVTKRDVQVMFTVPKARLRVVNDDMDRASLRSASDSALSRAGSLRHERSFKGSRPKSDGEMLLLPMTQEEQDSKDKEKAA